jgi:hypothetical protein
MMVMIQGLRGQRLVVHTYDGLQLCLGGLAAGRIGMLALLSGLFRALGYAWLAARVIFTRAGDSKRTFPRLFCGPFVVHLGCISLL